MKRSLTSIQTAVEDFFKTKNPSIRIKVKSDSLLINVSLALGDEVGILEIENRFFDQGSSWESLTTKLDEYWDETFPNEGPVRITPWPRKPGARRGDK